MSSTFSYYLKLYVELSYYSVIIFMIESERKKERKKVKSLCYVQLFATPWTVAYQSSSSMGFSRQEYWSGLPFPSPEIFLFL